MELLALIHLLVWIVCTLSILLGRGGAGHKIGWILVIFLFPLIGLLVYLFFGRSRLDA